MTRVQVHLRRVHHVGRADCHLIMELFIIITDMPEARDARLRWRSSSRLDLIRLHINLLGLGSAHLYANLPSLLLVSQLLLKLGDLLCQQLFSQNVRCVSALKVTNLRAHFLDLLIKFGYLPL